MSLRQILMDLKIQVDNYLKMLNIFSGSQININSESNEFSGKQINLVKKEKEN